MNGNAEEQRISYYLNMLSELVPGCNCVNYDEDTRQIRFEELTPQQVEEVKNALIDRFGQRLDSVNITTGEGEHGHYIALALNILFPSTPPIALDNGRTRGR